MQALGPATGSNVFPLLGMRSGLLLLRTKGVRNVVEKQQLNRKSFYRILDDDDDDDE